MYKGYVTLTGCPSCSNLVILGFCKGSTRHLVLETACLLRYRGKIPHSPGIGFGSYLRYNGWNKTHVSPIPKPLYVKGTRFVDMNRIFVYGFIPRRVRFCEIKFFRAFENFSNLYFFNITTGLSFLRNVFDFWYSELNSYVESSTLCKNKVPTEIRIMANKVGVTARAGAHFSKLIESV